VHRVDYIAKSYAGAHEMPVVYAGDALAAELAHFIGCIHGKLQPRVTGEHGLAAMKLAWRIEAALEGQ
jgi:predicted dehydrogenase